MTTRPRTVFRIVKHPHFPGVPASAVVLNRTVCRADIIIFYFYKSSTFLHIRLLFCYYYLSWKSNTLTCAARLTRGSQTVHGYDPISNNFSTICRPVPPLRWRALCVHDGFTSKSLSNPTLFKYWTRREITICNDLCRKTNGKCFKIKRGPPVVRRDPPTVWEPLLSARHRIEYTDNSG